MMAKNNHIFTTTFFICMVGLITAFTAEYLFDMEPCPLCIYQRYVLITAGLIAILGAKFLDVPQLIIFIMLIIIFLINAALATYQVSLEYGWIEESLFCRPSTNLLEAKSIESLRKTLIAEGFNNCSKPKTLFFGWSMAFYNIFFSLGLSLLNIVGFFKNKNKI